MAQCTRINCDYCGERFTVSHDEETSPKWCGFCGEPLEEEVDGEDIEEDDCAE